MPPEPPYPGLFAYGNGAARAPGRVCPPGAGDCAVGTYMVRPDQSPDPPVFDTVPHTMFLPFEDAHFDKLSANRAGQD